MKKVLVFTILCMVLLLLVPGVVSADDNNSGDGDNSGTGDNSGDDVKDPTTDPTTVSQSGHTVVTYGVSAMYYLVVPNDFTLGASTTKHAVVKITDARLPQSTKVNVTVSSVNYNSSATDVDKYPAWRMGYGGSLVSGEYVSYHLHSLDRTPKLDAEGKVVLDTHNNIVYEYKNENKVVNNTVFLTAYADSFSNGDGEVIKSLKFELGEKKEYHNSTYSGNYWDTLVFSAVIVDKDGLIYSPPSKSQSTT